MPHDGDRVLGGTIMLEGYLILLSPQFPCVSGFDLGKIYLGVRLADRVILFRASATWTLGFSVKSFLLHHHDEVFLDRHIYELLLGRGLKQSKR